MPSQPHSPSPDNPTILAELLADHEAPLRAQAARHAPSPDAAEDAFQDGCVELLRYYRGPAGLDALRYLMVAVKQRAWALRRDSRRSPFNLSATDAYEDPDALSLPDEGPGPVSRAERRELHRERLAALGRLKPQERTALLLCAAGYSYAEIGERRRWTQTKVNRCLSEGRAALRRSG